MMKSDLPYTYKSHDLTAVLYVYPFSSSATVLHKLQISIEFAEWQGASEFLLLQQRQSADLDVEGV